MKDTPTRYVLAIIMGAFGAVLVYWTGAVVALLLVRGIPLGSAGGPPTTSEVGIHLLLATIGGFVGGLAAGRLSRSAPLRLAVPLAAVLGLGAIIGFGNPAGQWPRWFGFAMAISCAVGVLGAFGWISRR